MQQLLSLARARAAAPGAASGLQLARIAARSAQLARRGMPLQSNDQAAAAELLWLMIEVLVRPSWDQHCRSDAPLLSLRGAALAEALHALSELSRVSSMELSNDSSMELSNDSSMELSNDSSMELSRVSSMDTAARGRVRRTLRASLASAADQYVVSAVQACQDVLQLADVVRAQAQPMQRAPLVAGLVQLARLQARQECASSNSSRRSSSSNTRSALLARSLTALLLGQLRAHATQLAAHQAATTLWAAGQLVPLLPAGSAGGLTPDTTAKQLLAAALAGVHTLNVRVCAMLLHGAARLSLPLLADDAGVTQLLQHTEQQLGMADPQALSNMVWALGSLQLQPGTAWLSAWCARSKQLLVQQPHLPAVQQEQTQQQRQEQRQQQRQEQRQEQRQQQRQHRELEAQLNPRELAAALSGLAQLAAVPPGGWLAAAAHACQEQLQTFQHRELALALWGLSRLYHDRLPPLLLDAAMRRVHALLPALTPQSCTLLLHTMCRQLQQQQQQHAQVQVHLREEQEPLPALHALAVDLLRIGMSQLSSCGTHDLALLSWSLGTLCRMQHQRQQQSQQQQQHGVHVLEVCHWADLLDAAGAEMQHGGLPAAGLSMLVWGLGTAASREPQPHYVSAMLLPASQPQQQQQQQQQRWQQGTACSPDGDNRLQAATLFWHGVEAQSLQQLPALHGRHLASLLWGGGSLSRRLPLLRVSGDWADALACQCLERPAALSLQQLAGALQGLLWLNHPRGGCLLLAGLCCGEQRGGATRRCLEPVPAGTVLLLLRVAAAYRVALPATAAAQLLAAARRCVPGMSPSQLAQLAHLLGKLEQQQCQRQRQQQRARHGPNSSQQQQERQQQRQQQGAQHRSALQEQSLGVAAADGSSRRLVNVELMCELASALAVCLPQCTPNHASLAVWGMAQLAGGGMQQQQQQQQQKTLASHACASPTLADCPDGSALLRTLYMDTAARCTSFNQAQVAMLLHAVHRLGVTRPPTCWLDALTGALHPAALRGMSGQALAASAVALAAFDWTPPPGWSAAAVDAALAAQAVGDLGSGWQRARFAHGMAALDPAASQVWAARSAAAARRLLPPQQAGCSVLK
jgi:hypothetical protein